MLKDTAGIRRVVIACGFVDLRKEIDGPARIIGSRYGQNPFEKGTLFLFCGRRSDRTKGLVMDGKRIPSSIIKDLRMEALPGPITQKKPRN